MVSALKDLGCEVLPSHANFIAFSWPYGHCFKLCEDLRTKGILITPMGDLPLLPMKNIVRMTLQTPEENSLVLNILQELAASSTTQL